MTSKIILYNLDLSPPTRAVKIIAHHLGLDLELRNIDLIGGEHLKEPFIKINPEHTVPTIDDDGKIIWDSHAICTYLIDKYAPNDALYPKDLYLRAKCNQRLHFDSSILFRRLYDCGWLVIRCGASEMPSDKIDAIHQAFEILEKFVTNDPYLVGNVLTVSDICAAVTVTSLEAFVEVDTKKYPHIVAWLNRVRQFGSYKAINSTMEKVYVEFLRSKMLANKQK